MKAIWLLLVMVLVLVCVAQVHSVLAAETSEVTITAIPTYVTSFMVTKISDTQVDVDWIIPVGADRFMVRAKYGEPPDDPGGGAAPTDGYVVYFGTDVTVSDTSMNLDTNGDKLYYRGWSVTPADFYTMVGEDFVEGIGMTLIALSLLPLALSVLLGVTRNMMWGFPALIFWAVLGGFAYGESVTTWDVMYLLFLPVWAWSSSRLSACSPCGPESRIGRKAMSLSMKPQIPSDILMRGGHRQDIGMMVTVRKRMRLPALKGKGSAGSLEPCN